MTIPEIIEALRREHCGPCKIAAAIAALESIEHPPQVTMTICPPSGAKKIARRMKADRRRYLDAKTRTHKPCNKCHVDKPLAEFPANTGCADGHTGECKDCTRERGRKYAARKREKAQPSAADSADLTCKLCHSPASSPERLARHMERVHNHAA